LGAYGILAAASLVYFDKSVNGADDRRRRRTGRACEDASHLHPVRTSRAPSIGATML